MSTAPEVTPRPSRRQAAPVEPPPQPVIQYVVPLKSVGTAYLLWAFFGLIGAHHYYLGKVGRGVLYSLTLGVLGLGVLVDLFTLKSQVRNVNRAIQSGDRNG